MPSKQKSFDSPHPVSSDGAAVAPALEATGNKKTTRRPNGKTAAATHKTPARKPVPPKAAEPVAAKAPFNADEHHTAISAQAYILWLEGGSVDGRAHEDWSRAAEIVRARYESD